VDLLPPFLSVMPGIPGVTTRARVSSSCWALGRRVVKAFLRGRSCNLPQIRPDMLPPPAAASLPGGTG